MISAGFLRASSFGFSRAASSLFMKSSATTEISQDAESTRHRPGRADRGDQRTTDRGACRLGDRIGGAGSSNAAVIRSRPGTGVRVVTNSATHSLFQPNHAGVGRCEPAGVVVERPQMIVEVDVQPFATRPAPTSPGSARHP